MAHGGGRPLGVRWPPCDGAGAVCVGYSGGLDSTVLLHALHDTARAEDGVLSAVHVHHGLSPNADAWAERCVAQCARLSIPIDVVRVALDRTSRLGIEGEARRARYAVYAARPEPFVALAHHRDDQAESLLLQLLRGTGLKGAAAMPMLRALNDRVTLYRPLLAYSRAELEARARALGLEWIDDESNERLAHDRNYLRHEIAPRLDGRFPAWRESFARFASHAADAQALLEELAAIDGAGGATLALDRDLPPARRANALRGFLGAHGLAMPSDARLEEMARQLYEAREDARIQVHHDGVRVTRYRGMARIEGAIAAPARVAWHGEARIDLGAALGSVDFEPAVGEGVAAARTREGEWYVAPRSGGEKLRLATGAATRTLKNLLQERGIAPAERERLPLLFHGERLVWVPGVGIAAEYACNPGEEGLKPLWKVAGKAPLC
jgi:tRNA(Ile)-lysidine synthase